MNAVAQIFVEFIAQDSTRALEFTTWLMARGDFSLPVKAACLLLKVEVMKEKAALDTGGDKRFAVPPGDFTAEALAQAAMLLEGEG